MSLYESDEVVEPGIIGASGIGYKELAGRLNEHGLKETGASISSKLQRGTFPVTSFLAALTVLEMDGVTLSSL